MTDRTPFRLEINARGIFEIRWSEKRGGAWRSRERSTRARDLRAAEAVLARFVQSNAAQDDALLMTVADALEEYRRDWSEPRGNMRTDAPLMTVLRRGLGHMRAADVRQAAVDDYAMRRGQGQFGRTKAGKVDAAKPAPAKPSSIRREIGALQAALNFVFRRRQMPEVRFDRPKDGDARVLWLTEDQEAEIIGRLPEATDSVAAFFRMGVTYGARSGAMTDLRFGPQVDFVRNQIDFHVPDARLTRKRRPKGPMTPEVRAVLERLFVGKRAGDLVLDRSVVADFRAWMGAIGFGWVTPHVLKHTAITLMLRGGVEPVDVSRAAATDLATIMRVYRHYTEDEILTALTARRRK